MIKASMTPNATPTTILSFPPELRPLLDLFFDALASVDVSLNLHVPTTQRIHRE